MVNKRMYQEIKRLQRLGHGKNKISKELGIDKKTVRKYYSMNDMEYSNYIRKLRYREKEFDDIREIILELYENNDNIKLPVSAVYDYLEESLGTVSANENSLRNYIRYLEKQEILILWISKDTTQKLKICPMANSYRSILGKRKILQEANIIFLPQYYQQAVINMRRFRTVHLPQRI